MTSQEKDAAKDSPLDDSLASGLVTCLPSSCLFMSFHSFVQPSYLCRDVVEYDNNRLRNLPQNLMEDARAEVAQVSVSEETRAKLIEEEAKKIATEEKGAAATAPRAAIVTPTTTPSTAATSDEKSDAKRADEEWEQSIKAEEQKKPGMLHC
jgi:hypothetical protein